MYLRNYNSTICQRHTLSKILKDICIRNYGIMWGDLKERNLKVDMMKLFFNDFIHISFEDEKVNVVYVCVCLFCGYICVSACICQRVCMQVCLCDYFRAKASVSYPTPNL